MKIGTGWPHKKLNDKNIKNKKVTLLFNGGIIFDL